MHRIIKNRTKVLQIAVVAIFMAVAVFAAKPAQAAKFTMMGGYKYVGVTGDIVDGFERAYGEDIGSFHGAKLHFLWSMGQRHDEKRARHLFGFGIGGGSGNSLVKLNFFDVSLNYEYIFSFGLGLSGGLGTTIAGGSDTGSVGSSIGGAGGGVSDLGVRYHLKNGLLFSTTVDLQSGPLKNSDMLYAINVGLGYEF